MRMGVLDVGSNTIHLLVVDVRRGGRPESVRSHKTELRLAELLQHDGSLGRSGTQALVGAVHAAQEVAEHEGVDDFVAFATSAVRDATDSDEVLADVRDRTGVELVVLPGEDEARLTFLAARRWFGWSAGRMLSLDIGGGSFELAVGGDEEPDVALSLPIGAGRVAREHLADEVPAWADVERVQAWAREQLLAARARLLGNGSADLGVASSTTFRSLARLDGAAPSREGPLVPRRLRRTGLRRIVGELAGMRLEQRRALPGVSAGRAQQILAGAVVAHEALDVLGLDEVRICPWALREGVALHRLDSVLIG